MWPASSPSLRAALPGAGAREIIWEERSVPELAVPGQLRLLLSPFLTCILHHELDSFQILKDFTDEVSDDINDFFLYND